MLQRRPFAFLLAPAFACALALGACGGSGDGPLDVAIVDSRENLLASGVRLSSGGQQMRAATFAGLVALDAQGEVVPALADRWIVTDDARSYIFRLRDGTWPDGSPLTAASVQASLQRAIDRLEGTSLGLDLHQIQEVRAMAGRVIEIRLSGVQPALLQMLAQPELTLAYRDERTGPMALDDRNGAITLSLRPPSERGLPEEEDWAKFTRPLVIHPASAQEATQMFDDGRIDVLLGGTLNALPLVDAGPLSRGTVRLDPAIGLFGLQVRRARGPLADEGVREGIAMALNRTALMAPFNVGGWTPTTRVVLPGLPDDPGLVAERWEEADLEQLRARASGRIAAWRAANDSGDAAALYPVTVAMEEGPGYDTLFAQLARQLRSIGLDLRRVEQRKDADLVLVDQVARYASPAWFLNQFHCSLRRSLCNSEADEIAGRAAAEGDPAERARLLAEAEAALTLANVYIPFGSPLRWSLVRGNVEGYAANPWAFHPLPDLAQIPR